VALSVKLRVALAEPLPLGVNVTLTLQEELGLRLTPQLLL
jgi:hypothetical protein